MSHKILVLLALIVLCSLVSWSQMPPQPCKLVIKSEPPNATVTINGVSGKHTEVTFIVTPGTYKVSVGGQGGNPYCAERSISLTTPGQMVAWLCSGTTWVPQSK